MNQQLFYAPIGSEDEPIRLNDDIDIGLQIPDLSPLPKIFGIGMNEEQVADYKSKCCGIEFPHFGARYPDARCCNGYLWDMDSWDESLGGFTIGGDDPCPVCNTEKWLDSVVDEDGEFETREKALAYVEQLKKRYLNYK